MISDLVESDLTRTPIVSLTAEGATHSRVSTITIECVRGADAIALLENSIFDAHWTSLFAACPWSTPFQSTAFSRSWYSAYVDQYEPILLISRTIDGSLVGLMPLAISLDGRKLVVAGDCQAEYQGWISTPEIAELFARQMIRKIRQLFPKHSLKLHYLAPGSPIRCLQSDAINHNRFAITSRKRPLMKFGDGSAVKTSLSKKNNKSRLRAMKKHGEVQFKKLNSVAEVRAIFDALAKAHDARRIAVNNIAPFAEDPARKAFYLAMVAEPNFIHATALMVGQRVAAAQFNYVGAEHVQLGLISYDPLFAEHSPGKMHILMLAKMLHEEGFGWLDITPGDDGYKQRFATDWDEVHSLTIYPTSGERKRAELMERAHQWMKDALMKRSILPARAQAAVREFRRHGILGMPIAATKFIATSIRSTERLDFYSISADAAQKLVSRFKPHRDSLDDLMAFEERSDGLSRQKFLRDAFDASEDVLHVYTHAGNERLELIGWLAEKTSQIKKLSPLQFPKGCGLIVGAKALCSDASPETLGEFVRALLVAAASGKATATIFVEVPSTDSLLRQSLIAAGMKLDRALTTAWWFGRRSVVASRADGTTIARATVAQSGLTDPTSDDE